MPLLLVGLQAAAVASGDRKPRPTARREHARATIHRTYPRRAGRQSEFIRE